MLIEFLKFWKKCRTFSENDSGKQKGDRHGISPEIPYESRYFSVLLDEKERLF